MKASKPTLGSCASIARTQRVESFGDASLVGQHQQHGCGETNDGKWCDDAIAELVHQRTADERAEHRRRRSTGT